MITRGLYVRVLWLSQEQMEELYLYAYQFYKIASRRDKGGTAITEHPQCHHLADLCSGFVTPQFVEDSQRPAYGGKGECRIPLRNLEHQVAIACSRIEPAFDNLGQDGYTYISKDILVIEERSCRIRPSPEQSTNIRL